MVPQKIDGEKSGEYLVYICMLKTRFKSMGRGILPYLTKVNNFIYILSILNRKSFLAGSLEQGVNNGRTQSLSVYYKKNSIIILPFLKL